MLHVFVKTLFYQLTYFLLFLLSFGPRLQASHGAEGQQILIITAKEVPSQVEKGAQGALLIVASHL